ncbi:WecB/TagA/CpsF family glycosyltransferase [Euhalothece natronophila Z-M001]|uniref:WecB/TagA/CpsF family glycosyltransferase n=1 Tax=Euhalothece natronophila Z-M001 TaxID=522448 RepID=A0A5B8NH84_9CHRO|nr:WecB/TagA/CpsF family glycosyltransferase [Euhalothece natronophila]QDZ38543.1 WecB/TagA/CpsF family glycosyltransferase [Euhalothece natronophila Z-M001]
MTFSSQTNSLCHPETETVLGIKVHLLSDYLAWLQTRYEEGKGTHVVTLNAEMVMLARKHPELASAIAQADLVIPDGAGVVLSLRLQGKKQQRYPGIELAAALISKMAENEASEEIFFYGGEPERAAIAAKNWQHQYPQLSIHTQHGYLSPKEQTELCETLQAKQPRLILVGLGVPRQELWIAENRHLCPNSTWIGIGGAFDIWSGSKPRAPQWFCEHNLEWLYRFYQEPSRWQRMLVLPQFAWAVLTQGNNASR